jgi:hypothetical protein
MYSLIEEYVEVTPTAEMCEVKISKHFISGTYKGNIVKEAFYLNDEAGCAY